MATKPLAYVCSPLRAYGENTVAINQARARGYCLMVHTLGYIPVAPHLYFTQFLSDDIPYERALGLELGLEILKHCKILFVFGDHMSTGMTEEIALANELGIEIRFIK